MVEASPLVIGPVITLGIILGLYELILIHRDENFRGSHWLGHGIHAVIIKIHSTGATTILFDIIA